MLKSLKIENFRSFKSFELQNLGRINLLVGENNSGKTSVLEAVHLLKTGMELSFLNDLMQIRNEYISSDKKTRPDLDLKLLFNQRSPELGDSFEIQGKTLDHRTESLKVSLQKWSKELKKDFSGFESIPLTQFSVNVSSTRSEIQNKEFPINSDFSLPQDYIQKQLKFSIWDRFQFISFNSISSRKLVDLFEKIELTPKETQLYEAIKVIQPDIERVAPRRSGYDSFRVLLKNLDQPIPLRNLGAGVWHILTITLALLNSSNGVLLVDDIDTGLHFSVMSNMWKIIWETARKLDIQVFATTHSSDCWQSLADIAGHDDINGDGIRIHRIEKDAKRSVIFDERKIVIAANREIEVR